MKDLYKFYTPEETVNFCVGKIKKYVADDTVFVEPSAGGGAFLSALKSNFNNRVDAYDIVPEACGIQQQDFLDLNIEDYKDLDVIVIGNPPFGSRNSLSVKFFKKSIQFANVIGFILPISQLGKSSQMYEYDLVESFDLGVQNYSGTNLHCCFNIYKRPEKGLNKQVKISVDGLECIEYRRDKNDTYKTKVKDGWFNAICSWGNGSIGNNPEYIGQYSMELYFYSDDDLIKSVVNSIDWKSEVSSISAKKLPKGVALQIIKDKLEKQVNIKHGDKVEIEGFVGEVIKVTDSFIEVLYIGDALHCYIDECDIDDDRVTLVEEK